MSLLAASPSGSGAVPSDRDDARAFLSAETRIITRARQRGMGITLLLFALLMATSLGSSVSIHDQATFILSETTSVHIPNLVFAVRWVSIGLAIACALVGAALIVRRSPRGTYLLFTLGAGMFLWSFLGWAARGATLNLVEMIGVTLISAVPIVFGVMSGVLCERSGVINIAIEGQFLIGAFLAALVASATGDLWVGLIAGAIGGGILGLLLAFLSLRYAADQIIVGVVIVALATGLTDYLSTSVLEPYQNTLNTGITFANWPIPLLDKIPIIGPVLFDQNVFVYLAMFLLVAITTGLFRTRWGLRVRAVGEHPEAAETVGISVLRVRYRNVILGGVVAGIGGAAFTIGSVGEFTQDMTSGLGFVALACMIFGRWRPYGGLAAALIFGFAISLQSTLAVLNVPINSNLLATAPYLITIAVVAGLVGQVRPPAYDGKPYRPQ